MMFLVTHSNSFFQEVCFYNRANELAHYDEQIHIVYQYFGKYRLPKPAGNLSILPFVYQCCHAKIRH